MDQREFVDAIRIAVAEAAVLDAIESIESPPGRRPAPELVALARWYESLDDGGRKHVREVVALAAHSAVFGFLCAIDGVRALQPTGPKGELVLTFLEGDRSIRLNEPHSQELHVLFGPEWPRPRG